MAKIELKNLYGGYDKKIVLFDIELKLSGRITAIAGPNGSGKSTLLKYLIKQLKAQEKTVYIDDLDITHLSQISLSEHISFVSQKPVIDSGFTVEDVVAFGLFNRKSQKSMVDNAISLTGLEKIRFCDVSKISGGQLQMVMLARAICQDCDIMALDEPLNNLDPYNQIQFMKVLRKLSQSGKTIICVLHDLNQALLWCDDIILIKDGRIIKEGPVEKTLSKQSIKEVFDVDVQLISLSDGRLQLAFCCNP